MASQHFSLEPEGPPRVTLAWTGLFRDFRVTLDGELLGTFADKRELLVGAAFALPDGSSLGVRRVEGPLGEHLEVTQDGVPLPGSEHDPRVRVRSAVFLLWFFAATALSTGLLARFMGVGVGPFDQGALVLGAVYAVLAARATRGSRTAIVVGLSVVGVEVLASLMRPDAITLTLAGIRVAMATFLVGGLGAARKLEGRRPTAAGRSRALG